MQTCKRKREEKNNAHVRALNWLIEEVSDEFSKLRNVMKRLKVTKLNSTVTAREMRYQVARCAAF
jgi:hypothetical protein